MGSEANERARGTKSLCPLLLPTLVIATASPMLLLTLRVNSAWLVAAAGVFGSHGVEVASHWYFVKPNGPEGCRQSNHAPA